MISRLDKLGPYGVFATTPELVEAEDFVDDYSLAFKLGSNLLISEGENIGETILNAVYDAIGPEITFERELAVSALTAEARIRALRREECRAEKRLSAIRHERMILWPPFSLRRIKEENSLNRRQGEIYDEQGACNNAISAYLSASLLQVSASLFTTE